MWDDLDVVQHLVGGGIEEERETIKAFLDKLPVALVVFGASWCGPCRALDPVLERLAKRGTPVMHIDVDEVSEELAEGIESVPTLHLYAHGKRVADMAGAVGLNALQHWINQNIPKES